MNVYRSKKSGQVIRSTYDRLLTQWGCEITERDIPGSFGTTHVIECGRREAPPCILFHGVGDDSALMWIYNAEYLSHYFHLYAVDTLGGPGKSEPDVRYNRDYDDLVWIDEVLAAFDIDKAYFVGTSHGGYLVQLYTLRRPERVLKGISISGAVPVGEKNNPMKAMMRIFLPEALLPTDRNVMRLMKKLSGSHVDVFTGNADIMAHYKALLKGFNNMVMVFHKVSRFSSDEVERIRDKIVYLVGEEDPFEKIGGKAALEQNRMNAVFYPDAGHGLNHELAEEINRKIVSVLSEKNEQEENDHV